MSLTTEKKIVGTNKYSLLESHSKDVTNAYEQVFAVIDGSLTTVADNDATSKINIAMTSLKPTAEQVNALNEFHSAFKFIETRIDPLRLNFDISKALDDEICINRTSDFGVSKIIIHEDGLIAYSFISYKGVDKIDILDFYSDSIDYETLTFNFFS